MTFLGFLSVSSSSLFVYFTKPAPYFIKETAYVFIAMILVYLINFVLLSYSLQKFSFILLLSLILFFSKIPTYLYPFFSASLLLRLSHIPTPLDNTTFPLFSTSTSHIFIPNSILVSLLNIYNVEGNPFTSRSLFAKIFKSPIKKRSLLTINQSIPFLD